MSYELDSRYATTTGFEQPPPSYSTANGYTSTYEKPMIQDMTQQSQSPANSELEVNFDKWTQGSMTISADGRPMYTVDIKYWKYKLIFSNPTEEIATANIHTYKMSFEVEYPNKTLKVHSDRKLKIQRSYDSPAFGQKIIWKSHSGWKSIDYICSDETGKTIARFNGRCGFKWKKAGSIEFAEGLQFNQAQKDEIVIVGVSLAWQIMQCMSSNASASSSGSSVAAAVAVS